MCTCEVLNSVTILLQSGYEEPILFISTVISLPTLGITLPCFCAEGLLSLFVRRVANGHSFQLSITAFESSVDVLFHLWKQYLVNLTHFAQNSLIVTEKPRSGTDVQRYIAHKMHRVYCLHMQVITNRQGQLPQMTYKYHHKISL